MQLNLIPDDRTERLTIIHSRLTEHFGLPEPRQPLDPVSQLVMGLIGGRTRGAVSATALTRLRLHYADWESLRDAPVTDIEHMISGVTFAEIEAPWLKAALLEITVMRGALTLDFLAALPVSAALAWLERLPGVGRKTAATVLNFSTLRRRALVIDTHHLRVITRLGLVGHGASMEQAYDRLAPLLPSDWSAAELDAHHQLVKQLGQCRPAVPTCSPCPLNDLCAAGRAASQPHGKKHRSDAQFVRKPFFLTPSEVFRDRPTSSAFLQ
ncbi:endonuclease III domain-containing protein [Aliiroseovarius sp.]|uniref:endonuclease III domain-containing protein n=1 Tax=Aliiroseovarius sp. TaxID=1872442 RepID=UPI003BAAF413